MIPKIEFSAFHLYLVYNFRRGKKFSVFHPENCQTKEKKRKSWKKLQFYMVDLFFFSFSHSLESEQTRIQFYHFSPFERKAKYRQTISVEHWKSASNRQKFSSRLSWSGTWQRHSLRVARSIIDSPSLRYFHATFIQQHFPNNSNVLIIVNSNRNILKKVLQSNFSFCAFILFAFRSFII